MKDLCYKYCIIHLNVSLHMTADKYRQSCLFLWKGKMLLFIQDILFINIFTSLCVREVKP